MRRFFSTGLLGFVALLSASAWSATPAPVQEATPAAGLIIGFKEEGEDRANYRTERGPWASDRERARKAWDRSARRDRERVARLAKEAGVDLAGAGEAGNAHLLRFDRPLKGQALERALRRLRLHPEVAWVEPNVLVKRQQLAPGEPDDPLFGLQWHLQPPDNITNFSGLNLPAAWSIRHGSSVVVAVVDSGVRFDHPDLAGRLLPGYDMVSEIDIANDGDGRDADASDPGDWVTAGEAGQGVFQGCDASPSAWHGTFIAGQIAAASNNAAGVVGLNWTASVLPVRVSGKCGALLSDLLDGLRWAAGLSVAGAPANPTPARVINLSFGGDAPCSQAYQDTIDEVTRDDSGRKGALVVVAAGNGLPQGNSALLRPADCQRVMAVGAARKDGAKAAYSNFGAGVALMAPGGSAESSPNNLLVSTDNCGKTSPGSPADGDCLNVPPPGHSYGYKQGTSFSAPQAAGVASLMLGINPALSPAQLIDRMKTGARSHTFDPSHSTCSATHTGVCNCTTATCGAGLLDAERSMQLAAGPAAVIVPLAQVEPGSVVALDGRQSVAISGSTIVSYQWQQTQGTPVALTADSTSLAGTTLVAEGTYTFRLTVADDLGRTGSDTVQVVAARPPPPPGGGGSSGLFWGLALWAWVVGVAVSGRRRRSA
ncbi:S8 family serine peptidase [Hydrogenophaga sp.]|uniref:S8 family peptidase n=1 Tax=Hydrogenophaga sp. TaxID=1904254 RepID=UPI003F711C61